MKIGIVGCAGRMGRALIQQVLDTPGCTLAGGTEQPGPAVGQDLGALVGAAPVGVTVGGDTKALFAASDCGDRFHHARRRPRSMSNSPAHRQSAGDRHHRPRRRCRARAIAAAAKTTAIVQAANMSVGVNVLFALTEKLAATLGDDYDIEIVEMHHRHKVDSPSGTALALGEAAAKGRGVKLDRRGAHVRATARWARAPRAKSASPHCAAAMWSAITRSSSPPTANASSSRTKPHRVKYSPKARCVPPCGPRAARPASIPCATCWISGPMKPAAVHEFYSRLRALNPHPETELKYINPYTLLVAVVLSAQATDVGVNKATGPLFATVDTPAKMVALGEAGLKSFIKTIGLFNTKAKNVIALSKLLLERHGGEVPRDRESLEALPGVGRKTANVVLNVAFEEHTIAVDTHIFRVGNRTGLAPGKTPLEVEEKLEKVTPAEFKRHAHHWLILHGRYICKARTPECWRCVVNDLCAYKPKTPAPGSAGRKAKAKNPRSKGR